MDHILSLTSYAQLSAHMKTIVCNSWETKKIQPHIIPEVSVYLDVMNEVSVPASADVDKFLLDIGSIIQKKFKEWSDILWPSDSNSLVCFLDAGRQSEPMDILNVMSLLESQLMQLEFSPKSFSEREGKAGLYLFVLNNYYSGYSVSLIHRLLQKINIFSDFVEFYSLYVQNHCPFSKRLDNDSHSIFKTSNPMVLEKLTFYLNIYRAESFVELRKIYRDIVHTYRNEPFTKVFEQYLRQRYIDSIKIKNYGMTFVNDLKQRWENIILNERYPLLYILTNSSEDELKMMISFNHGKLIKVLQLERNVILGTDADYRDLPYDDETVLTYQKLILVIFDIILKRNDTYTKVSDALYLNIKDKEEWYLTDMISKLNMIQCCELTSENFPSNANNSCYVNSTLVTLLSDLDSPVCQLLNQPVAADTNIYNNDFNTNERLKWLAKGVKHSLIMIVLSLFYGPVPSWFVEINQLVRIFRIFHQLYYILNVKTTLDIDGNCFEDFVSGTHSESVIYHGFLLHLFRDTDVLKSSSVSTITKHLGANQRIIGYTEEMIANGLIHLNFDSSGKHDVQHYFQDQNGDVRYLVNTDATNYMVLVINQDQCPQRAELVLNPTVCIASSESIHDAQVLAQSTGTGTNRGGVYQLMSVIRHKHNHKYCEFRYNNTWYLYDDMLDEAKLIATSMPGPRDSKNVTMAIYSKDNNAECHITDTSDVDANGDGDVDANGDGDVDANGDGDVDDDLASSSRSTSSSITILDFN